MEAREILNKILKYSRLNAKSFSEKIGLERPQAIYDIQKGKTKSISQAMLSKILSVFPELNKGWLLTGEGEMLSEKNESTELIINNYNQGQPILDIRVCAGHGIGLEGDENKVVEWVSIPKFDGCYGITVYGDSMYDKFKSGDIIFVRPIEGRNDFDFGQCYIIITNEDRYIKNVYESNKGDEYITMTSFNTEINPDGRRKYPDRDIYIDDIKHLYKVAGKLRRDQL
ncbi:phage repressor protein C with HTH and peptisase S24 domain [Dysgonomonas alginatilytica]|uniref:Phage repressor protein C with HTH and peptisase S24 domain n=1 Tax=Dysgonomonas alginatilytica TaxID=1605892 RepID=A0A2V3PMJ4_9BACT|nr:S24 family peptidase [Dysgonomonas alginatilytica]PXV61213.1 phage repressor protein C with HTH and peptisase S24 domain [Dysgonomonas alginatilytica]